MFDGSNVSAYNIASTHHFYACFSSIKRVDETQVCYNIN